MQRTDKIIAILPEQQLSIKKHNETLEKSAQIPLVPRNQQTGWPLLQAGMLALIDEKYQPVLGGGKCHDLSLGHYFFALLLKEVKLINVTTDIQDNLQKQISRKEGAFLVALQGLGIKVSVTKEHYGNQSHVEIPGATAEEIKIFNKALIKLPNTAAPNICFFHQGTGKGNQPEYSQVEILKILETTATVFLDGLFYIDLGEFLKTTKLNDELLATFKNIFQVDAFNEHVMEKPTEQEKENKNPNKIIPQPDTPSEENLHLPRKKLKF